jgi:antirestriction protein ArdC
MSSKRNAERIDLYADVTNRVLAELEKGPEAWTKSWKSTADLWRPINQRTERPYRGVNIILLALATLERGYASNAWVTFRQALELGGSVRKGAKGVRVVFWRQLRGEEESTEPGEDKRPRMVARHFYVFNVADCDGLENVDVGAERPDMPRNAAADEVIYSSGAVITPGEPAYLPGGDVVRLPPATAFDTAEDYYATALHELTHWTAPRVGREINSKRWGDDAYAVEELVAELGAAMLCGHCGIPAISQCAAYLDHWIRVLRQDKRAIFSVSSAAQKATDFLLERAGHIVGTAEEEAA